MINFELNYCYYTLRLELRLKKKKNYLLEIAKKLNCEQTINSNT